MHTLRILTVSLAILGLASSATAKPLLAVLDFSESRTGLHADELSILGDVSRGAALQTLGQDYDVITRENLVDLLKAHGKFLASCSGECETETGRLLGAELVVSGRIVKAFGKYKVNLKVHRTDPPALLGAEMMTADDHGGLEVAVRTGTVQLLSNVPGARGTPAPRPAPSASPSPPPADAPVPAPSPAPETTPAAPSALDELRNEPWSLALTNVWADYDDYAVGLSATGWLVRTSSLYWQALRASYTALWGDVDDYYWSATTTAGYRTSLGADGRSEFRFGAGVGWMVASDSSSYYEDKTYEKPVAAVELAYTIPYEGDKRWVFVLEALFPTGTGQSYCWDCAYSSDETWYINESYFLHTGIGF
ncbi:MAG: hypothetical protein CL940_11180 [Deltaproteobacteria bacterium]|nr:hypothetical protein [Deltaproteobacteria bacterium]